MKNFCSNSGAKLKDGAKFCAACGEPVETPPIAHYEVRVPRPEPPKHTDFSCMLAYVPGLFWVPMVSDHRNNTHREAANQGLILTILCVLFGTIAIAILGNFWISGYDFGQIPNLFLDFTAQNWLGRLPQILGWLALTALVMYVPINSICGFFHGMASEHPYHITLFGRLKLIRPIKKA